MSDNTPENPSTKYASGTDHVRKAAEDLKAAAEQKMHELRGVAETKAGEFRDRAQTAWGEAQTKAKTLREDSESYVRERPIQAVLTAFGVGLFLGLLIRR